MKLKLPLFFTFLLVVSLTKAQSSENPKSHTRQYNRRVTFDMRLEAIEFFSLKNIAITGKYKTTSSPETNYGGLLAGFGVPIDKRFHIDAVAGFSKMNYNAGVTVTAPFAPFDVFTIPAGVDAHINILKRRFSPFIHLGGGYLGYWVTPVNYSPSYVNSAYANAGIGFYARLTSFLALAISPEYRLVYYPSHTSSGFDPWASPPVKISNYVQQIGLQLAVIFY